jgi:DNA invertase Pin-like site-specific DNA recombinase
MTIKITGQGAAQTKEQIPVKVGYCLYARKSTESEEQQVLSIDSQIKEMVQIAERENLHIAEIRKESHSAKAVGQRPVFNELVQDIREGKFTGILTWAPDRLSRNAGDLGALVDLMDQKLLIEIRTYSQKFTNSPSEKFMLMILCSQAKLENDNKSENVKRGLRTRVEQGLWPSIAPTGYLNEKRTDKPCSVILDPDRAPMIKTMFEKVANDGWSGQKLYNWLKFDQNFKTRTGKHLSLGNLYIILQSTFYYGVFEYPKGSGKWYTGKHAPIITKDLYDRTQQQINRSDIKQFNKEFAFTRILLCGLCGSGITADEKLKKQKNGNVHRYVYYGCCKSRDRNCKSGYMREEDLIEKLAALMDQIDLDEIGIKGKIRSEIARHRKFQSGILGVKAQAVQVVDIDIRNYAKYILRDGTIAEKRELLACLRSRITVARKEVGILSTVE